MGVQEWFFRVAVGKALKRIVQLVISYILALQPEKFGVTVQPEIMTPAIFGLLDIAKNFLKVKLGWKFL